MLDDFIVWTFNIMGFPPTIPTALFCYLSLDIAKTDGE